MFKIIKKYTTLTAFEFIGGSLLTGIAAGLFIFVFTLVTMGA